MRISLLVGIIVAIAVAMASSATSYQMGYSAGLERMKAAAFVDTFRNTLLQAHFVARERPDMYFWQVDPTLLQYPEVLQAAREMGMSEQEIRATETLIVRYFYARNLDIPAETAALMISIPDRSTYTQPKLRSKEDFAAALSAAEKSEK